ncbi:galanin receptor type 1-like isoform X2 [Lineus longissimus]
MDTMAGNQTMSTLNVTTSLPTNPAAAVAGVGDSTVASIGTIAMIYTTLVMLGIIAITGTAGNALVIYVFSKRNDNQTSTIFIIGLAIVDMATCAVIVPFTMVMEYMEYELEFDALCKIYHFAVTSNVPFSALIMSAIAVDRYLCICHPFLHAMNIKRAKICILCLGLFSSVLGAIVAMMHGVFRGIPYKYCNVTNVSFTNGTSSVSYTLHSRHLCPLVGNETIDDFPRNQISIQIENVGVCEVDDIFFQRKAREAYQKIHVSVFLLCLLVVIVLYTLIYKSVLMRRRKRAKMKKTTAHLVARETSIDCEETILTTVNGTDKLHTHVHSDSKRMKRKSTRRDRQTRMQNIKTAAMLFVVTVVFVITFLPAALMANAVIDFVGIVFYMYFANNVANPVIYSFMNKNFRDDLKKIFNCK